MSNKFFYVYGEGRGVPTVKHANEQLAIEEARRLSALFPNVDFHVLEVKSTVKGIVHTVEKFYL